MFEWSKRAKSAVPELWMQFVGRMRRDSGPWPCFFVSLAWEYSLYTVFVVLVTCVIYEKCVTSVRVETRLRKEEENARTKRTWLCKNVRIRNVIGSGAYCMYWYNIYILTFSNMSKMCSRQGLEWWCDYSTNLKVASWTLCEMFSDSYPKNWQ
jgi:hypothetical protein